MMVRGVKTICKSVLYHLYRWLAAAHRRVVLDRLLRSGRVTIGRHSYGVPLVRTYGPIEGKLKIGGFVSIADQVEIHIRKCVHVLLDDFPFGRGYDFDKPRIEDRHIAVGQIEQIRRQLVGPIVGRRQIDRLGET